MAGYMYVLSEESTDGDEREVKALYSSCFQVM